MEDNCNTTHGANTRSIRGAISRKESDQEKGPRDKGSVWKTTGEEERRIEKKKRKKKKRIFSRKTLGPEFFNDVPTSSTSFSTTKARARECGYKKTAICEAGRTVLRD